LNKDIIYDISDISEDFDRHALTRPSDQCMETSWAITGRRATYAGASDVMSLLIGAQGNVIAYLVELETSWVNKAVREREGG
jgi:hypothetical protein